MINQSLQFDTPLESSDEAKVEKLRVAKIAAESANARKSEFLAVVSHELRTPLQAILSCSRQGQRRSKRSSKELLASYFWTIEKSGNVLLKLLNQLLNSARTEYSELRVHLRTCDLADIICGVIQEFVGLAEERRVEIRFNPLNTQIYVLADHDKIAHVVRNLLINALNVSKADNFIDIQMSTSGSIVTVRVVDQGPGIPESKAARIFEKYSQSSRGFEGAQGTGLGLPICLKTITQHGGRIWAENGLRSGAAVCFELPQQQAQEP